MALMIFQLFDSVKLTEDFFSEDGDSIPVGTLGAIVEVLKEGEAYIVELFGGLVKYDDQENFVPASPSEKGAFVESIGIETVYPHQIELYKPAREMVSL